MVDDCAVDTHLQVAQDGGQALESAEGLSRERSPELLECPIDEVRVFFARLAKSWVAQHPSRHQGPVLGKDRLPGSLFAEYYRSMKKLVAITGIVSLPAEEVGSFLGTALGKVHQGKDAGFLLTPGPSIC